MREVAQIGRRFCTLRRCFVTRQGEGFDACPNEPSRGRPDNTNARSDLSEDGRAFAYLPGGDYEEIAPAEAIDEAFAGWDQLLPQPSDPDAVRLAIQRARSA
jgi:hypothetical protein